MTRPGFSFLVCPDVTLLKEELDRQTKAAASGWKRLVFWGDEEPGAQFWESLQQVGLFAENRVLVVRQADAWPAAVWKGLSRALSQKLDHVWPIFCLEVDFEKGKFKIPAHIQKSPCHIYAEKQGWIWSSQGIGQNMASFVRSHAKKLGLVFTPADFSLFCERVPPVAQTVINELEKLALLADNGNVTTAILPENSASRENDAFGLIRKLQMGDLPGSWQEIARDTDGSLLFFLLALLAREFRILWQIASGEQPYLRPSEAKAKNTLARKLGKSGLASGFACLADAEWQVKSGRQRPEQTLQYLCAQMFTLFQNGKPVSHLP